MQNVISYLSLLSDHIRDIMYGFIGYRRTFRVRELYALLAFLVGICIGFILTTRTRIQIVAPNIEARLSASRRIVANKDCASSSSFHNSVDKYEKARQLHSAESSQVIMDEGWEPRIEGNEDVLKDDDDDSRKLIFIGVMTAQKYLETRAMAVYNTWANHLPGRVVFFAGADAEVPPGLPVVQLHGVDDTYPPQKKSFLMLKYMFEHYGDSYEWFMRADDDVYIRGDRLASFLNSINSSWPQFIGQAGTGNKEEFGQLYLENDENFCMGGPGVVFSRETLRRVAPNVRHCLKNLYSTHEDVEVGRCVRRFAGIPCTWSYEMQSIFYHNSSGDKAFTGILNQKEIHRAITLHPIKLHTHLYRLHNFIQSLSTQGMRQKTLIHYRDIRAMVDILSGSGNSSFLISNSNRPVRSVSDEQNDEFRRAIQLGKSPSLTKGNPSQGTEVVKWDFMQRTIYSHTSSNPRRKVETGMIRGLDDVIIQIMDMINKFSKQRGRMIDFKDILYGYHRFDNMHGVDYILDLLLVYKKYRGRKMTIPVRKHVYVQQAFTELEVSEVALPSEQYSTVVSTSEKINFIIPLSGRFHIFKRFMKNFEKVCLVTNERVSLTITLFSDNSTGSSITDNVLVLVREYQERYVNIEIYVDAIQGSFSRAKALQKGSARFPAASLLFFVDVDMYFTPECLRRIRLNTIYGKQVYFPIVFSQYDPTFHSSSEDSMNIDQDVSQISSSLGYWRQFGFGIASLYHGDLNRTGGLDVTIQGWGKEDVDLYDKIVTSDLAVFRAPDPDLIHIFHPVQCDPNLTPSQFQMCLGSRASNYAGVHKMAKSFYSDPKILEFATKTSARLSINH